VCRGIRTANGLSQKEVAEAGGLGQSRVSEIGRGRYLSGLDMAMRVAKGLGVSVGVEAFCHDERRGPSTTCPPRG
jgi:transcriptional regulator with XRE-family HTH domain